MSDSQKKHLRVEYNGIVLFDGHVDEVNWTDSASGVTVNGRVRKPGQSAGGNFLDLLAAAAKKPAAQQDSDQINHQAAHAQQ